MLRSDGALRVLVLNISMQVSPSIVLRESFLKEDIHNVNFMSTLEVPSFYSPIYSEYTYSWTSLGVGLAESVSDERLF